MVFVRHRDMERVLRQIAALTIGSSRPLLAFVVTIRKSDGRVGSGNGSFRLANERQARYCRLSFWTGLSPVFVHCRHLGG